MRAYIIAFVISMVAATILNEVNVPPQQPLPVAISGVEHRQLPVMHEDGLVGEVNFADRSREAGVIKQIRDGSGCREAIYFPYNANN